MIRKSGYRFSEKIMLKQRDQIMSRFNVIGYDLIEKNRAGWNAMNRGNGL
jgi:hypothetical protein